MKTRLFASMALASAILFTSCSKELDQDRVITDINNSPIAFSTYSSLATKGTPIANNTEFCTNGRLFNVSAFLGESEYMSATIKYVDSKWEYNDKAETAYWPAGTLDFYAVTPTITTTPVFNAVVFDKTTKTITYTVPTATSNQVDVMYAKESAAKPASGTDVQMNFKHALSQVHFAATTDSKNLFVDIEANGINIHNVNSVGTFNIDGLSWSTLTPAAFKTVNEAKLAINMGANQQEPAVTNITSTTDVLMLIPQNLIAWDNTTPNAPAKQSGSYLSIICNIYNKANGTGAPFYLHGLAN